MLIAPRTPVLVAAGVAHQRSEDPLQAAEPVELMLRAAQRAQSDSRCPDLLRRADSIRVPRGFWDYPDPGRWLANKLGAAKAKSHLAEIGILQTTLLGEAAQAIAAGEEQVALICGGEAKYRSVQLQRLGLEPSFTHEGQGEPDHVMRPAQEIWSQREADLGLLMPVNQYSIMENALRFAEHKSLEAHRQEIATLWADFSRVAATNPDAWDRREMSAAQIASPDASNRMLAYPYSKHHNSQWNVDQAAALVLCSVEAALAAGIPQSQWVFPLAVAESNHMLPLSRRAQLHRAHGFRIAGARALAAANRRIEEVSHLELYSCFPIAVRVQERELAVPPRRARTVTGGMAFAGGPLNNFVLQAWARMVSVLRADPLSTGMVNAVSGMLTKQGVSLLSAQAPEKPFQFVDVSSEVEAAVETVDAIESYDGPATVASYTVIYDAGAPPRAVLFCDVGDGRRVLVPVTDAATTAALTEREGCGRKVHLSSAGATLLDVR